MSFGLALGAALCWGLTDFFGGVEARRSPVLIVVFASQAAGLGTLMILVAVSGAEIFPAVDAVAASLAAGALGAVGITAFYRALAIGTMSIVAPITAVGVAVPVLVGLIGGESPGSLQAVGIGLAILGIVLVTQAPEDGDHRRSRSRESIGLAIVAAGVMGFSLTAIDFAAESGVLTAVMWARVATVPLLATTVLVMRISPASLAGRIHVLATIGILDAGANVCFAIASTEGLLSIISVLSTLYPVVTVALATVLLGERVRGVQAAGVAFALLGTLLLAGG